MIARANLLWSFNIHTSDECCCSCFQFLFLELIFAFVESFLGFTMEFERILKGYIGLNKWVNGDSYPAGNCIFLDREIDKSCKSEYRAIFFFCNQQQQHMIYFLHTPYTLHLFPTNAFSTWSGSSSAYITTTDLFFRHFYIITLHAYKHKCMKIWTYIPCCMRCNGVSRSLRRTVSLESIRILNKKHTNWWRKMASRKR